MAWENASECVNEEKSCNIYDCWSIERTGDEKRNTIGTTATAVVYRQIAFVTADERERRRKI